MFKIEGKLKKAAQKRAKKEGITLSDLYQFATRSFVDGRLNVGLTMEGENWSDYTKESKINFQKGLMDLRAGRVKQVK